MKIQRFRIYNQNAVVNIIAHKYLSISHIISWNMTILINKICLIKIYIEKLW